MPQCTGRSNPQVQALSLLLRALGDMEMSEMDESPKTHAMWELFHMLFRERHWALVHLALASFGYFAARTSCNQLWQFVPQDAALSFDLVSGNEIDKDRFMLEFSNPKESMKQVMTNAEKHNLARELEDLMGEVPDSIINFLKEATLCMLKEWLLQ